MAAELFPGPVIEILAQQAEFPKLIGDVLADIGDGAVGADDHFAVVGILVGLLLEGAGGHHPAAFVLAFGFEINGLALLQLLEGGLPKLQVQDLALARQHIVVDAQALPWF